jgi:flagellar motor switch protein FliN/FliY
MDTPKPNDSEHAPSEGDELADQILGDEEGTADLQGNADPQENADIPSNLRILLDIPLEVSVELGRSKILVSELIKLGQGSVVELNKLVDEPMDILVNQKPIAKGEVVVSNDKFGVRLTDILEPMERLEKLQ